MPSGEALRLDLAPEWVASPAPSLDPANTVGATYLLTGREELGQMARYVLHNSW